MLIYPRSCAKVKGIDVGIGKGRIKGVGKANRKVKVTVYIHRAVVLSYGREILVQVSAHIRDPGGKKVMIKV